jgi:hypothetical protein
LALAYAPNPVTALQARLIVVIIVLASVVVWKAAGLPLW